MNESTKRRFALAAVALGAYAACADQPAPPQHSAFSDGPKQQRVAAPEIPVDWTAPPSRVPRPPRATRSQRGRSEVRGGEPRPEGGDVWHALAMCETGGTMDQRATSATGKYLSYFQWSLATWHSVGGQGDPRDVDYETQRQLAIKLQARSGWGQWPVCSRKIGAA